jgi:hypothetical protein
VGSGTCAELAAFLDECFSAVAQRRSVDGDRAERESIAERIADRGRVMRNPR